MSVSFDYYDFKAVIIPGTFTLFWLFKLFPDFITPVSADISFGTFSLFTLLSFVTGHIIHSFGQIFEKCFWRIFNGIPTDWVFGCCKKIITDKQKGSLGKKMKILLNEDIRTVSKENYRIVVKQIYQKIQTTGNIHKLNIFNANYGLQRGLAVSCIILSFLLFYFQKWELIPLGLLGSVLFVLRMYSFAENYAQELYIQFLNLP